MMPRFWLTILLITLAWPAFAATSRIELTDGSTVVGEIESMAQGRYVIRTRDLGRITIPASRIRRIEQGGSAPPAADSTRGGGVLELQRNMMSSPEIMRLISDLQNDPELMAAIADPSFMQRIAAGDLEALRSDPQMKKLLAHPAIRRIIEQVQGSQ